MSKSISNAPTGDNLKTLSPKSLSKLFLNWKAQKKISYQMNILRCGKQKADIYREGAY